jgi:hypothetical protein
MRLVVGELDGSNLLGTNSKPSDGQALGSMEINCSISLVVKDVIVTFPVRPAERWRDRRLSIMEKLLISLQSFLRTRNTGEPVTFASESRMLDKAASALRISLIASRLCQLVRLDYVRYRPSNVTASCLMNGSGCERMGLVACPRPARPVTAVMTTSSN